MNSASGPTTIELIPGTYSRLVLYRPTNHGPINIVSQDPTHISTIQGLALTSGTNISFADIDFVATPGTTLAGVYASSNISFTSNAFHGSADVTLHSQWKAW